MNRRFLRTGVLAAVMLALGSCPAWAKSPLVQNASPVITVGEAVREQAQESETQITEEAAQASEEAVLTEGETLAQTEEIQTGSEASASGGQTSGSPVLTVGSGESLGPASGTEEELSAEEESEPEAVGRVIDPSRPMVALTFDDGPQTAVGNQIMDCLAQYDGKATFFLVGSRVPGQAAEVQRMVAEGHEVANHTMNHRYLQKLGAAQIQAEVNQCNDTIQAVCGVRPTIMRLPGGNHNATVLASTGMPMIQWSIDTLDWKTRNADATVTAVLNQVQNGDIVLMHELYGATGEAACRIIPELAARGYQMVTVSEMAAARGMTLSAGQMYSAMR